MELLKAKQEEEKRRLEEQLRSRMEVQRQQMENMMRANLEEMQRERQSVVAQNRMLQEKVEGMQKSLNERNDQIANLQRQMKEIAPDAFLRCLIAKRCCIVEEIKQRPLSDLLKLYQIQSKIDLDSFLLVST